MGASRDLAGIEEQPSMPPESSLQGRMTFSYYGPGQAYRFGSWQKIGSWYAELSNERRNDSPELAQKARQLTASATSTFDKAAALAGYLQSEIRYVAIEVGIGGFQPHFATDIFQKGYGDCKDKATLLSSLLRDVGVSSQLVLVHTQRGTVAPDSPSAYFNHAILAVQWPAGEALDPRIHSMVTGKSGAHWVIFDPTDPYTPFGEIGSQLETNYVLITGDSGGELVQLPLSKPESNELRRVGKLKLEDDGTLAGEIEETRTGDVSWQWRVHLIATSENDRKKEIDEFLARYLSGFVLDDLSFDNLHQNDRALVTRYKFTAHNYARKAGSLLLLRPRVLGDQIKDVGSEKRKYPVYYRFASHQTDTFHISLPAGYAVDELPDPAAADLGFAAFHSKAEFHDGTLTYADEYTVRDVLVEADRVDDVRRLNGVVTADQRSTAVLKKTQ